jgi:hypothetical protein
MAPTSTLVPPRRLGTLLRRARRSAGMELTELTAPSGLTVVELEDIEYGRRDLDDALLSVLVRTYGIEDAQLVPERSQLVIDLDDGRISVEGTDDVGATPGPDAVLARYLGLVYRLRGLPVGAPLPLRDVDIEVLSSALELASEEVESRLHRLMRDRTRISEDQRRIRRQLLMPLVGIVVAATGIGTLVLVAQREPAEEPTPDRSTVVDDAGTARIGTPAVEVAHAVDTDLGNGAAVEENPAG